MGRGHHGYIGGWPRITHQRRSQARRGRPGADRRRRRWDQPRDVRFSPGWTAHRIVLADILMLAGETPAGDPRGGEPAARSASGTYYPLIRGRARWWRSTWVT